MIHSFRFSTPRILPEDTEGCFQRFDHNGNGFEALPPVSRLKQEVWNI
jgi:hypothetical protein